MKTERVYCPKCGRKSRKSLKRIIRTYSQRTRCKCGFKYDVVDVLPK